LHPADRTCARDGQCAAFLSRDSHQQWGSLLEIAISGERVGVRIRGDADKWKKTICSSVRSHCLAALHAREDARRVLESDAASLVMSPLESLVDAVALSVNLCVPWQ